jgi:hypothetical protein
MWGFIPTDLLPRLKDIIEGSGHQYYLKATPKVFVNDDSNSRLYFRPSTKMSDKKSNAAPKKEDKRNGYID